MVNKMELVDREKIIAQYSANPESKGFMELVQDDCVVEALKKAEVVDAAPVVHAKWEKDPTERRTNGHIYDYRCSECHGMAHKGYYGNKDYRTMYCHHCGAKMDLE